MTETQDRWPVCSNTLALAIADMNRAEKIRLRKIARKNRKKKNK